MEKLYKYLNKIGVEEKPRRGNYTPAPAEFYRVSYGNSYFYNAPGYTYPGAVVTLDYNTEAPAEYYKNMHQIETRLQAYCKKYGYSCRREYYIYTKNICFFIEKQSDKETAATYYYYVDACREECEQAAHALYTAGHPERVEATLREIMQRWGAAYNERLNADEVKTA